MIAYLLGENIILSMPLKRICEYLERGSFMWQNSIEQQEE
jgi:hypothetical protein